MHAPYFFEIEKSPKALPIVQAINGMLAARFRCLKVVVFAPSRSIFND